MYWLVIFGIIFINNIIPVFAPPTWLLLSFVAVYFRVDNFLALALLGALSATLGRLALAALSDRIMRNRFLSEKSVKNIDDLKKHLLGKKAAVFYFSLAYALSPLSSSQLFIAYGLTELPRKLIAIPFFFGRLVSYAALSFASIKISQKLSADNLTTGSFFTGYFIFSQILTFLIVYLFVKIDWHLLFADKKLRFKK